MYISPHHMHPWFPQRSEEGIASLRTGIINSCELIYGFWDSNSSLLQEQEVVLTTEQSLQLQKAVSKWGKPTFDGVL